ncbi:MAG: GH92 family glycosyl hydrolase [Bacteroidota bacterium]
MKQLTFWTRLLLALVITASFGELTLKAQEEESQNLLNYVDPFIGTSGKGNTHPGAVVPWGMVAISPHTFDFQKKIFPTCFSADSVNIYSFGIMNLSGVGCPGSGSVPIKVMHGNFSIDPAVSRSTFSETIASPGFFSTLLEKHKIKVEISATERSGILSFALPSGENHFFLDLTANQGHKKGGEVWQLSNKAFGGFQKEGNFCGSPNDSRIYFYLEVDQPPFSTTLLTSSVTNSPELANTIEGPNGVRISYGQAVPSKVEIRVGISFVSVENAQENLQQEQKSKSFQNIREEAESYWQHMLERVMVDGGSKDEKVKFYTGLYHSLLHPNILSDVNGQYPVMEGKTVGTSPDVPRYTTYSLWDTYRTLHPLLTLLYPEKQEQMVNSMLGMYQESGWLPKWELFGAETAVMVGDPSVPVIVDSYLKGIQNIDTDLALEAFLKSANTESNNRLRPGNAQYLSYGYIPIDKRGGDPKKFHWDNGIVWGPVSTTLEYNLADWNIAQFADAMGKDELTQTFLDRSQSFVSMYDVNTGFLRPKNANGEWMTPFNPLDRYFDIRWKGSGGRGYVEGTAWNYLFFTPHGIDTLINLMGKDLFLTRLDSVFSAGYFDISNEPDISYPFLYNYFPDQTYKTSLMTKEIIKEEFTTAANGIPGNDDAGTLSAWLVFAMMGMYPDCPGSPRYQLFEPSFDQVELSLNPAYHRGEKFLIRKESSSGSKEERVNSIFLNGELLDFPLISHEALTTSGTLVVNLAKDKDL